jgi:hypothetical protein
MLAGNKNQAVSIPNVEYENKKIAETQTGVSAIEFVYFELISATSHMGG